MHRNGDITGYSIQYGATTLNTTNTVSGTSNNSRIFTASGLIPLTTYMFRIAAVNSNGTGPYSSVVSIQTSLGEESVMY